MTVTRRGFLVSSSASTALLMLEGCSTMSGSPHVDIAGVPLFYLEPTSQVPPECSVFRHGRPIENRFPAAPRVCVVRPKDLACFFLESTNFSFRSKRGRTVIEIPIPASPSYL